MGDVVDFLVGLVLDAISTYGQKILADIPIIILSLFGALVRALNSKKRMRVAQYLVKMVTGVFVGYLIFFLMADSKISDELKLAVIMLSGYCAGDILEIIVSKFIERLEKYSAKQ